MARPLRDTEYVVTPPNRWGKGKVHHTTCRWGEYRYRGLMKLKDIPDDAEDCKVCGGRGGMVAYIKNTNGAKLKDDD